MPNEIQVHILCYLDDLDILALRIASKKVLGLLHINASVISRVVLGKNRLEDEVIYLKQIYRAPTPVLNLDHFLQMMHRERIVLKMVSTIADYVQTKIYQVKSASRRRQFAPSRLRMERRLKAPVFITYHFLERLRAGLVSRMKKACSSSKFGVTNPSSVDVEFQTRTINGYPEDLLLPAFQFYRIMVSAYRQKLRPPTYAGTIERKIRGWDRTPATDADVAQVLIYGGMEEVLKIMLHPTYGARLQALNATIDRINGHPLQIGSKWMEAKSNPKVIRDLDIPAISDNHFMLPGSNEKLTTLYLPWLSVIVAKRRATVGAENSVSDPQIPSPFAYIEDLLKDHEANAVPVDTGVTMEDFSVRANAPDDDEEHTQESIAGPSNTPQGPPIQHRSLNFPSQYG